MKNPVTLLLLLLLFLLGGCLEFDAQDVYLRYDDEADRIDALFVYRGVFAEGGNGSGDDPIAKAIKDLDEARETGEFTFWYNWPFSCNPSKDYDAPRNALLTHVEVENGGLFTDPQGLLCAYQFVRVNRAQEFVKKLNTLIELGVQAAIAGNEKRLGLKLSSETSELVREFLRSREKMLVLERGRIELRLPLSRGDHDLLRDRIADHLMDNLPGEILRREAVARRRAEGGAVTDTSYSDGAVTIEGGALRRSIELSPSYRFFWENDFSFVRTAELTTIGLGVAGDEQLHVKKAPGGLYHPALLERLREKGEKVEDGLPDAELFRRFEGFRGRDAKLPPQLAQKRG